MPRGIGSGKGTGLTGVVIMVIDRVWFICAPAPSLGFFPWPLAELLGEAVLAGCGPRRG